MRRLIERGCGRSSVPHARPPRTAVPSAVLALLTAALAVAIGACSEDDPRPFVPEIPAGRIQGLVRTGGSTETSVIATRVPDERQLQAIVIAHPDASGTYSMDVPAGRYVVGLGFGGANPVYEYSAAGLRFGDTPPDTIEIDHERSPVTIDFLLGALRARATFSPQLNGEPALVYLHRRGRQSSIPSRSYVHARQGTITDGLLDVTLTGVLPGAYRVEVVIKGAFYACLCALDGEHVWIPGTRDSTQASWFDVLPEQETEVLATLEGEPARIEGAVTGAWLEMGLGNPDVALIDLDSNLVRGRHIVDDDGSFEVDIYLPVPVKVLVVQDGIEQWVGGRRFDDAQVFDLERGRTISGLSVVQSGIMLEMNRLIEFPEIRFHDPASFSLVAAWNPQIGSFENRSVPIANLPPGVYLIRVEPKYPGWDSWMPQWFDRASRPEDAQPVTIASEGEIVSVAMTIQEGGTIAGVLTGPEHGTEDFYVVATTASDPDLWGFVNDGPERSFEVQGLPDGSWKVGAWRRVGDWDYDEVPQGTVWYPGTLDWNAATPIEIAAAGRVDGIEIPMP